jgi:hypothetical protein
MERKIATVLHIPTSMAPMASPIRASVLDPPPATSMKKFNRMPRSPATTGENVESLFWYDIIPSTSFGPSPASASAVLIASTAMARVLRPECRLYSVSPTPTIAYLSRRLAMRGPSG